MRSIAFADFLIGVGILFVLEGLMFAAIPGWMRRAGLEWLYRLSREPKRLWRRYLYLNPYYLYMIAGQALGARYSLDGRQPVHMERYG